jgi:hypothetical protein
MQLNGQTSNYHDLDALVSGTLAWLVGWLGASTSHRTEHIPGSLSGVGEPRGATAAQAQPVKHVCSERP